MYADNRQTKAKLTITCNFSGQNPPITRQQATYPVVFRQQYSYPVVNQAKTSPSRPPRVSRAFIVVIKKAILFFDIF